MDMLYTHAPAHAQNVLCFYDIYEIIRCNEQSPHFRCFVLWLIEFDKMQLSLCCQIKTVFIDHRRYTCFKNVYKATEISVVH